MTSRWEWRTFGESFGPAESRIAAASPARVDESDEIYAVSIPSDASVKLRGGQIDVKERLAVDAAGVEHWQPVIKGSFPVAAADVVRIFEALGVDGPASAQPSYSVEQLAAALAAAKPEVRVLRVHKRRAHHTARGCPARSPEPAPRGGP